MISVLDLRHPHWSRQHRGRDRSAWRRFGDYYSKQANVCFVKW